MSLLLVWLVACAEAPPAAPPAPPPAAAAHTDAGAHGHGAAHGGVQKELEGLHVEALAGADGVMFWVTDADARPLPPEGITGTAVVKGPNGVQEVTLMPMADHLHAPATLPLGQPATVVVTLTRDGKAQSASYEIAAVGLAAHDHTSLHGGVVGMWGDVHVEYLPGGGRYRVWVSDANRVPIHLPVHGTVTDGDQKIPLTDDGAGGLSAPGADAGARPVDVDLTVGDASFSLRFNAAP